MSEKCAKCANISFSNLPDQLVLEDSIGTRVDAVSGLSADVSHCEVVPLKQFARAGKRGHYLSYGACFIDQDSVIPSLSVDSISHKVTKD